MDSVERDIQLKILEELAKKRAMREAPDVVYPEETITNQISNFMNKNILESLELGDFKEEPETDYERIVRKRIERNKNR